MKPLAIIFILFACMASMAWAGERSITLEQAVQLALRQNPEILEAEGKLEQAEGGAAMAKAQELPMLALHGFATTGNTSTMLSTTPTAKPQGWIMSNPEGAFGGDLSFEVPVYTGGHLGEGTKSASFDKLSRQEKLEMAKLDVEAEVVVAYDAVLAAQADLKTAQADLDVSRESERIAETYYKSGKVPYFYLLRYRARLSQSEEDYLKARSALEIRSVQLSSVLGESSSQIFSPLDDLGSRFAPLPPFDSVLENAYENRPDLKGDKDTVDAFSANLRSVEGLYAPQVYFFSRYDSVSHAVGFNGYTVGLHASLPILDGGERNGEVKKAEGQWREAAANLNALKLLVKNEVAGAYYDFQTALKELDAARAEVKSGKENLRIVMLRFRAGKGIQLEILDAQSALTGARYHEIKALYDANASYALLKRAEGLRR